MKFRFQTVGILLSASLTLFALSGYTQTPLTTISPTDSVSTVKGVVRFEQCVKKPAKPGADMGILVTVADLNTLVQQLQTDQVSEVYFHIVAMEESNLAFWQTQNPSKMTGELKDKFALVIKYVRPGNEIANSGAYAGVNPLAMSGSGRPVQPPTSTYMAMGKLCPPPSDCTIR
jgi:hypothetical protein